MADVGTAAQTVVAAQPLLPPPSSPPAIVNNRQPFINDRLSHDFPNAATLPREDIIALLDDDVLFDAYFNTLPSALACHEAYAQRLHSNIALAEHNNSLKPGLEALRKETAQLYAEANDLKSRWNYLNTSMGDTFKRFASYNQQNRLRGATTGQEFLSEKMVSSFMESLPSAGIDEETFSRQYKEVRTIYHRRKLLLDKWERGEVAWN